MDDVILILEYIKDAIGKGLFYEGKWHNNIVGYSNAMRHTHLLIGNSL